MNAALSYQKDLRPRAERVLRQERLMLPHHLRVNLLHHTTVTPPPLPQSSSSSVRPVDFLEKCDIFLVQKDVSACGSVRLQSGRGRGRGGRGGGGGIGGGVFEVIKGVFEVIEPPVSAR